MVSLAFKGAEICVLAQTAMGQLTRLANLSKVFTPSSSTCCIHLNNFSAPFFYGRFPTTVIIARLVRSLLVSLSSWSLVIDLLLLSLSLYSIVLPDILIRTYRYYGLIRAMRFLNDLNKHYSIHSYTPVYSVNTLCNLKSRQESNH